MFFSDEDYLAYRALLAEGCRAAGVGVWGYCLTPNHVRACARYVELNPVRARLVGEAAEWRWSGARAHPAGRDDELVVVGPLLERVPDWSSWPRA